MARTEVRTKRTSTILKNFKTMIMMKRYLLMGLAIYLLTIITTPAARAQEEQQKVSKVQLFLDREGPESSVDTVSSTRVHVV